MCVVKTKLSKLWRMMIKMRQSKITILSTTCKALWKTSLMCKRSSRSCKKMCPSCELSLNARFKRMLIWHSSSKPKELKMRLRSLRSKISPRHILRTFDLRKMIARTQQSSSPVWPSCLRRRQNSMLMFRTYVTIWMTLNQWITWLMGLMRSIKSI